MNDEELKEILDVFLYLNENEIVNVVKEILIDGESNNIISVRENDVVD